MGERASKMEILFKFTKTSFFLGGKVLVTSESDSDDDSESSMDQPKEEASVNGTTLGNGVSEESKLAKAAAAATTVEHATIMVPPLQHRRNLSAFNWNRGQGYDKTLNKFTHDLQKNSPANWETFVGLGEQEDDGGNGFYQLRRTGRAFDDLKGMLEDHEVEYPSCSYEEYEDEFEEYDSSKLETIWEEEEDEYLADAAFL